MGRIDNGTRVDLSLLTDFTLVARHGGFGKAGRAGGRSKATLSRRVARLEDNLGMRLIERDSHAFRLTDAGAALVSRISPLLAEIHEATAEIADNTRVLQGVLRISAPVLFSQLFLGQLVADFQTQYPNIHVQATSEDRLVDLVEESYDAVIRVNPAPTTDLVGRIFMRDRYVVVARSTLELFNGTQSQTETPAVLSSAPASATPWRLANRTVYPKPTLQLPSLTMVRDAVLRGAGAAALPLSIVREDITAGRLINHGPLVDGTVELWVLHTSRRLASSKVRAFVNFLCSR